MNRANALLRDFLFAIWLKEEREVTGAYKVIFDKAVMSEKYTQFIIRLCKERDGISGEIVGARAKSVTTHVLYVAGKAALNGSTTTTAADKVYNALFKASGDGSALKLAYANKKTDAVTKLLAAFE